LKGEVKNTLSFLYLHNVFGPCEGTFLNSQYGEYHRWERLVNWRT